MTSHLRRIGVPKPVWRQGETNRSDMDRFSNLGSCIMTGIIRYPLALAAVSTALLFGAVAPASADEIEANVGADQNQVSASLNPVTYPLGGDVSLPGGPISIVWFKAKVDVNIKY